MESGTRFLNGGVIWIFTCGQASELCTRRRQRRVRRASRTQVSGHPFQSLAYLVELSNLIERQATYEQAAPGQNDHKALSLQFLDRFAHRRSTDGKQRGKHPL